jgi:flavin-binding protein dodecin
MPSQKRKVRVISLVKKTSKDVKKKTASDGISRARKSLEEVREVKAQREARQKEL